jgi:hypothetical protein
VALWSAAALLPLFLPSLAMEKQKGAAPAAPPLDPLVTANHQSPCFARRQSVILRRTQFSEESQPTVLLRNKKKRDSRRASHESFNF